MSCESGLAYTGESGGLSESYSDIFASVCESRTRGFVLPDVDAFKIAEDIWTPGTPGDAIRYLYDPKLDGASLDSYAGYTSSVDVHYSSGIPNLAYSTCSIAAKTTSGRYYVMLRGYSAYSGVSLLGQYTP